MGYTYILVNPIPSYDLDHTLAYHRHLTFGCHHTFTFLNINPFTLPLSVII